MEPYINIWDLDVIDVVDPVLTLGNKKKKGKKVNTHRAAILLNPLFASINIQILLICPKAFLTVLVGRNCFKTGLSSPLVIIFFILITSILG